MRFLFLSLVLGLHAQAQVPAVRTEGCNADTAKTVIARAKNGHSAAWTLEDTPSLHLPFAGDQKYRDYVQWVRKNTIWDARRMLANHVDVSERLISGMNPADPFVEETKRENAIVQRIIQGRIGTLRPMSCLEGLPLREFMNLVDLRRQPLEMYVSILRKGNRLTVIGDFYIPVADDGGAPGAAESQAAARLRRRLGKDGWELLAIYHNHPFTFSNPYGDFGAIAPSNPDVMLFLELRPRMAMVSDGIETFQVERDQFSQLR